MVQVVDMCFFLSILATLIIIFVLGGVKGLMMQQGAVRAGLKMVFSGCFAASCAYAIGYGLQLAMGLKGADCLL